MWFDLLVLTPGRDWQGDIDAGIDTAAWFALLVSAESLASASVAREVKRAIDKGRPLYLLILDDSPRRLGHAPEIDLEGVAHGVIDFRRDFRGAFRRLVSSLQAGSVAREPIRSQGRAFPFRVLPPSVAETIVALWLPVMAMIAIAASALGDPTLWTRTGMLMLLSLAGASGWAIHAGIQMLKRRLESDALFLALFAGSVTSWAGLLQTSGIGVSVAAALTVAASVAGVWAIWRAVTDADLMRWIPQVHSLGFNIHRRRQFDRIGALVSERQQQATAVTDPGPYFYRLHHAPDDRRAAELVRTGLEKLAVELPPGGVAPAEGKTIDFLLLSNRMSAGEIRQFLDALRPYPVVLIASAVTLPGDLAERLARMQWLEFREQLSYQISGFVMALRRWEPARLLYASNVRPHGFAALAAPIGTRQGAAGSRSLAASWLAAALLALAGLAPPVHLAAFALAAWQLALTHWVYRRSCSLWVFLTLYLANVAAAWWLGTSQLLAEQLTVNVPYLGFWSPRVTLWLIAAQAAMGLLQYAQAWRWFPIGWPRRDAIGGPPHAVLLKGHIVYAIGALFGAIYMAINPP